MYILQNGYHKFSKRPSPHIVTNSVISSKNVSGGKVTRNSFSPLDSYYSMDWDRNQQTTAHGPNPAYHLN